MVWGVELGSELRPIWLWGSGPFPMETEYTPQAACLLKSPSELVKTESRTRSPNSVGLEWSLGICLFNEHPGSFGCWWFTEHPLQSCYVVHQIFQRKSPQTQTSGILTGKWLQLTNANIWLVQLFLYHHYLWMVLDEEINDIKWWIISKSFWSDFEMYFIQACLILLRVASLCFVCIASL